MNAREVSKKILEGLKNHLKNKPKVTVQGAKELKNLKPKISV